MSQGFFDVHAKVTAQKARPAAAAPADVRPLTVTQLTSQIERVVKGGFPNTLHVQGEISNYHHQRGSGHCYFTLKDAVNCIDCVIWKSDLPRIKFVPESGMELIATGRLGVYGGKGRYQLYVNNLHPIGQGALELAFKQLCARLEAEGLFAAERKRKLPRYPLRLALLTSRETAALQDMLKVLRRFAWVRLMMFHVPVQGDGAGPAIAAALRCLGDGCDGVGGIDAILLARGGGSLEDLWAFNEECVARAIVACRVPVVTGVGHEVDVSIADLVADYHAHTPTEAAQVVTQHWKSVVEAIESGSLRLRRGAGTMIQHARQRLSAVERHETFRRPMDRVNSLRQLIDDRQRGLLLGMTRDVAEQRRRVQTCADRLERHTPASVVARFRERVVGCERRLMHAGSSRVSVARRGLSAGEILLPRAIGQIVRRQSAHLDAVQKQLDLINPAHVLRRGYTITKLKRTGQTLKTAEQVKGGERLVTRFADGQVESVADDPKQPGLFE